MVRETIGDNEALQLEIVASITQCGDPEEALHWAQYYNIPGHKLPPAVRSLLVDKPSKDVG